MNDRAHRRKLGQNYLIDPVILFEIERAINPQKNNKTTRRRKIKE